MLHNQRSFSRPLVHRVGLVIGAALALGLIVPAVGVGPAFADRTTKKIQAKAREAMENFDLLEYEEAKKLLNEAIVIAKKAGKERDPAVAKVHLNLGIVYFAGFEDVESAKVEFINAVEIDPKIEIDPAYKTAEMDKLLSAAKKEFGKRGGGDTGPGEIEDDVDCDSLQGIAHTLVDTGEAGSSKEVSAHVSAKLKAAKVSLMYRPEGVSDFIEAKMEKAGGCRYVAKIPGKEMRGEFLHYYIAAYNKAGKVVASKGSAGSPNIIEITASTGGGGEAGGGTDTENPFSEGSGGGNGKGNGDGIGHITKRGGSSKPKTAKLFLSIGAGSGAGYESGKTELVENDIGCCLAPALLHVFPELGFYLSPQNSLSVAFRMGFPLGANRPGHPTGAPAGFLRFRHALDPSGEGLQVSGSIGGGIIRHTVKLSDATADEGDTDTGAIGPLFLGGGVGYSRSMGGPIRFVAELNAVAGLPVVSELGATKVLNFAIHFDANLALLFAF